MKLDSVDLAIIKALSDDARIPFSQIAKELDIPTSTVHFRVKKMKEIGLIKGFTVYLDPFLTSGKKNVVALLIKAVPSKIKDIEILFKKLKQNNPHISILNFWPCVGDYNIIAYIQANRSLDLSMIMHSLKNSPALIEYKICNPTKIHLPFRKTFLKQLSRSVNKNG